MTLYAPRCTEGLKLNPRVRTKLLLGLGRPGVTATVGSELAALWGRRGDGFTWPAVEGVRCRGPPCPGVPSLHEQSVVIHSILFF